MNRRELPVSEQTPGEVVHGATEAYCAGAVDRAAEFIAPDAVDHSTYGGTTPGPAGVPLGVEGWRARWEAALVGVTDLEVAVERTVEAGDTVARVLTTRGTRDGQPFELTGIDIVRVRDGRIAEHWAVASRPAPGSA